VSIEPPDGRPEQQFIAAEPLPALKSNWFTNKRMNRAKWWTVLVAIGLVVVVSQGQSVAFAICVLASLPILILISIRRLHDTDKSAWWLVPFWLAPLILDGVSEYLGASRAVTVSLLFATLILQAWGLFEFGFRPGTSGSNRFGADPLYTAGDSPRPRQFGFTKRVVAALVVGLIVAVPSLFRQLRIESASQMPTLLAGDHVFYSNFERGYPRQDVRHGDMVAFRLPKDKSTIYSERVVGLPGDRVQMIDGLLHLNGVPVKRERVDDFIDAESGSQQPIKRWRETLPNGVSYETSLRRAGDGVLLVCRNWAAEAPDRR
jgi:signal peptidase I